MPNPTKSHKFGPHELVAQPTKDGFVGIVRGKSQDRFHADTEDELLIQLQQAALRESRDFIGYSGAIQRFNDLFPGGLGNEEFQRREVRPKRAASDFALSKIPPDESLIDKKEDILKAIQLTELLHPIEKAKLKDVLYSVDCAAFCEASRKMFEGRYLEAGKQLDATFKSRDLANWRILTYLPFLWDPKQHFFLRPTFLCQFAAAVGHKFQHDYSADLNPAVYESLLSLAAETRSRLGADVNDNIEVQSFIWVAKQYRDDDV